MKFSCRDHLCQLFHICWLDVDDIEALVLDVQIPQVDTEIITTDECLPIAIDRYAIDVVRMGIGIGLSRNSCYNCIVVCEPWKFQIGSIAEVCVWVPNRSASASNPTAGCQFV